MIVVYRPWLTRLPVLLVAILTLGLIRMDRPRIARLREIGVIRRWWMSVKARFRGTRDGRLGIPRQSEDMAPPEVWKLKQQGDSVVRDIAATWASTDARLSGEREAIDRGIVAADERIRRLTAQAKSFERGCEKRRNQLDEMQTSAEEEHPEERWRIPTWFYMIALGVIFIGEFPLNAVAFNLFGENRWPTYAMTAGLAAVLVFCAHSLGILWRQKSMSDRDMIVTVLLAILPVTVIVAIAFVREEYLEALNRTGGGLAVLSPAAGITIFIVMNLIIYAAAFALSYLHHDPVGEMIERAERKVRKDERRIRRVRRKIERANGLKQWLLTKVALWKGAKDEAHRNAEFQLRRHKDLFEAVMQEYWAANRRVTERTFKQTAARARRRGEIVSTDAETWKPPKALENPPEIAKDLFDRYFPDDLVDRIVDARDGEVAKRPARRSRKKASTSNGAGRVDEPKATPAEEPPIQ